MPKAYSSIGYTIAEMCYKLIKDKKQKCSVFKCGIFPANKNVIFREAASRMRPFFKDLYDSSLPEKWFSLAGNTLITAAAIVVWLEGSFVAGVFAFISYVCLATQANHGTRHPYEYLKEIYVYPHRDKWQSSAFFTAFFMFRLHVVVAPLLLVWWAYSSGKVPF